MARKETRHSKVTSVELIGDPPCVLIIDCANLQTHPAEGIQMTVEREVRFQGFHYDHAGTAMYNPKTKHFWTVIC